MIPEDLLSACPHRQFHTLPGLLDSRAALSDSYPNAFRAKQGGSLAYKTSESFFCIIVSLSLFLSNYEFKYGFSIGKPINILIIYDKDPKFKI